LTTRSRDNSRRNSDYGRSPDLDYRERARNRDFDRNNSRNRNYDRKDEFGSRDQNSGHKWRDTYKAGNEDGKMGQTVYPVQSRTQSGTFEQHDYTKVTHAVLIFFFK